ncbi:MAG TPA: hypothetical protein VFC07_13835 [Verrucomicrobiae bacterium]|nr:hypothetical protein [Verrucomicrobiae bacterium]
MSAAAKLSLIAVVIGGLVVNQSLRTQKSDTAVAFSTSAARSDSMDAYCANANDRLKEFLQSNNFAAASDPGYALAGSHVARDERQWFETTAPEALPFYVCISVPQSGSSGLECDVVYQCSTYRWRVQKTEAQAASVKDSLAQWWDTYQSAHPMR